VCAQDGRTGSDELSLLAQHVFAVSAYTQTLSSVCSVVLSVKQTDTLNWHSMTTVQSVLAKAVVAAQLQQQLMLC
jgi:peptidoglycan biosynthesis protein MviN/MurJ (putative lipid II flippase)